MIRDLSSIGQSHTAFADIAIIGGGTVGLLMASRLAAAGHKVIVVESGAMEQDGETHPLNEVETAGDVYLGATLGRARCLGGTSTRWGGAMLPFQPVDWEASFNPDWRIPTGFPSAALSEYVPQLEALFGLPPTAYDAAHLFGSDQGERSFLPRLAKWPPFRKRNTANLFVDAISERGLDIWLNATVTKFLFAPSGDLAEVEACSLTGQALIVRARHFVFCCGAIENTRLLLAMDRTTNNKIFAPHRVLGHWFHDHISAPVAKIQPLDLDGFNRQFGFWFEGSAMRNLRFEPTAACRNQTGLPAGFAHISFATRKSTGFDALRDVLRGSQAGRLPHRSELVELARHLPWLARAGFWRFARKRVLFPPQAGFSLNIVAEQRPVDTNKISLSIQKEDAFGMPLAKIDWKISDEDEGNVRDMAKAFERFWNDGVLARQGILQPIDWSESKQAMFAEGAVYHPGGSTRIGPDKTTGVTNEYGQCYSIPNVWPISTALFARGGGANPTMSLLLFGMRAADHLGKLLVGANGVAPPRAAL
jgi:choline dehydrogenase-like flavoprotein